jgi:ParB-like chromosome segregation protein Spo0J
MLTNRYRRVPCADIIVQREERQRTQLPLDDLLPSIKARGVIQPIVITEGMVLIVGERRLAASINWASLIYQHALLLNLIPSSFK